MIDEKKLKEIIKIHQKQEELSKFAYNITSPKRKKNENLKLSLRSAYALDRDRILYSGAYRRYQGKTQVFSFTNFFDEEMSNRNIHTTYVSQISRTIGKILNLNLDLIEAIALGHDLGHTPFGHDGEKALSLCCQKYGIGKFYHNIQSLHIVDNISRDGNGLNLSFPTRDGIISHDGEIHMAKVVPNRKKSEELIEHYIQKKCFEENFKADFDPFTLEGCVVKMADTVSYIGQDIEDAIRIGLLLRSDIPENIKKYLGDNNGKIIDTLIKSIVIESFEKDFICMDEETAFHLKLLKNFNYEKIYHNSDFKKSKNKINKAMEILFEKYLKDLKNKDLTSSIFKHFLNHKKEIYLNNFSDTQKIRDFISTMTDRYFNEELAQYLLLKN